MQEVSLTFELCLIEDTSKSKSLGQFYMSSITTVRVPGVKGQGSGGGALTMRTALSMSQSLNMMRGDFPPSSRETFFRLLTAQLEQTQNNNNDRKGRGSPHRRASGRYLFMICLPMGVEPVKPSLRTSGCSDRRCPTIPPVHVEGQRDQPPLTIPGIAASGCGA